jgi:hypothetical protein
LNHKNIFYFMELMKISTPADGVLATSSAHARPSDQKFSTAHVCKVTFKYLPQPLRTQRQLLK